MKIEQFPATKKLVGAYLYPFWRDEYPSGIWHALDDYLRRECGVAPALPDEIDTLLGTASDEDIETLLYGYSLGYAADEFEGGIRGWLTEVARRARLGPDDSLLPPPYTGSRPGRYSSTFPDQDTAEEAMAEVIRMHESEIVTWLAGDQQRLMIEGTLPRVVGREGNYALGMRDVTGVRVILLLDSEMPDGIRVLNGYPQHTRSPRTDLPALRHLAGAYFHQDWDTDDDYVELIPTFVRESPDLAHLMPDEIDRLRPLTEEEIDAVLEEFGFEYRLVRDETWHGWLDDLAARVRDVLPRKA